MYNNKKILAIIPARGGSKGLPNKNIKPLCGKPLIGWSIEQAQASKYIDEIFVSTDSHLRDLYYTQLITTAAKDRSLIIYCCWSLLRHCVMLQISIPL